MTRWFLLDLCSSGGRREAKELSVECSSEALCTHACTHVCISICVACQRSGISILHLYNLHYRRARTPLLISNADILRVFTYPPARKSALSQVGPRNFGTRYFWESFALDAFSSGTGDHSLCVVLHNPLNARQNIQS